MTLPPDLAACAALVEKGDPDRFAASMAAPQMARLKLWPLYALNLELARAPYASPEPLVAEMRLQWWVDQIEALGQGARPGGDVAMALAPLLRVQPDLAPLLADMAEARRWEVWKDPFDDRAAFDAYIDRTAGHLMWLAARLLGAPSAAEPVIRDFAWGAGLANWLTAVPELEARGRFPLVDGRPQAVVTLAQEGLARIARARAARQLVPAKAASALWSGWAARHVLRTICERPTWVAQGLPHASPLRRSFALLWRSLTAYW